jgi:hypothetical protein
MRFARSFDRKKQEPAGFLDNRCQVATSEHWKAEREQRDGDLKVVARFGKEPA